MPLLAVTPSKGIRDRPDDAADHDHVHADGELINASMHLPEFIVGLSRILIDQLTSSLLEEL